MRLGPAQAGGAHELAQHQQAVLAVVEDGRGDPEAELGLRRERWDADEGEQGAKVAEAVLDGSAGEAPPVARGCCAGGTEDLGGGVADFVGWRLVNR